MIFIFCFYFFVKKEKREELISIDFISQMPDDILVIVLSLMPIKDAVIMSSVSTRWRFLWRNLKQLNFDGSQTVEKIITKPKLLVSERSKYVNHVNTIIASYNHPMVQDFRIRFHLNVHHNNNIKEWLQFAADKKVEFLELDLMETCCNPHRYCFPLRLTESHLYSKSPSSSTFVELMHLKKLILKKVQVDDTIFASLIANCPHLETLSIHDSQCLKYVQIDGQVINRLKKRALKLKFLKISLCLSMISIWLFDFDLEIFTYEGPKPPNLYFDHLPKLKKLDFGPGYLNLNDCVFYKKSSWSLSLQDLSIRLCRPKVSISSPLLCL